MKGDEFMDFVDFDEETKAKLERSLYAQAVVAAITHLGRTVELVMNLRDRTVLEEMRRTTADVFAQAEAALEDGRVVQ